MKRWLIGLLFFAGNAFSQGMITKVIELNYVQADNVIQLIQPLLQSGEKISGSGQTLVVSVSPDTLTEIREVLHKIDVPPVTFNISIFQGDPDWLSQQNQNDVTYSTNPQFQVQRNQSVNVMSGQSALVSTGEQVPVVSAVGVGFYNTGIAYQQHNIDNGLLVQPVLQGSQVKLTVKRVRQQQSVESSQQFDNQEVATTVMAPLNKWVPLGTAEGAQQADSNSTSYTAGRPFSLNSTLYIKVTVVNALPAGESK